MTLFVRDTDFTLYHGDSLEVLRSMDAGSVHCCVTSPPYWGLRDYGTGSWDGGEPDHVHDVVAHRDGRGGSGAPGKQTAGAFPSTQAAGVCSCGATRVDRQLGLEQTPDEYVSRMVAVFSEVRRVLRDDGTLWLNLGDSYASNQGEQVPDSKWPNAMARRVAIRSDTIKAKDMVGIPWMVAFALRADGWYLRSDIIWAKPNPMPESVADRPTKAHEYVFLLSKSARYFFDADAVREPYRYDGRKILDHANGPGTDPQHRKDRWSRWPGISQAQAQARRDVGEGGHDESEPMDITHVGRNVRSVWEIATQPYAEAHFATFPLELPRRCIKAGTPAGGVVLDPFMGSGTTALVARELGRRSVGIELNADYCALAAKRLSQLSLLAGDAA